MDKSKIPNGLYCWDEKGFCPYWKLIGTKCAYCAYIDMSDKEFCDDGYTSLLWDQVKECEENMEGY